MEKRNYTRVQALLPEIKVMLAEGKTQRKVAEYDGFRDKQMVKRLLERERGKERKLEAKTEKLTQAARYERNEQRQGYHSGHYSRNLTTTSGDITLKVPKLKGISFETAIIERYRRRKSSVEEALIEMYLAGASVRRVEDISPQGDVIALSGRAAKSHPNRGPVGQQSLSLHHQ